MARCAKRAPPPALPAGMTVEVARTHPRFRYWLEPGARCELDARHKPADRHRSGVLVWYDPPRVELADFLEVTGKPAA